jgi:pyruvate carboxylase
MLKKFTKQRKHEIDKRKRNERNKSKNRESNVLNDFLSSKVYQSFKKLRNAFLKTSVLKHYDSFKSLKIEIDAFK